MSRTLPPAFACLISLTLVLVLAQSAAAAEPTLDQSPVRTTPDGYFYVGTDSLGKNHVVGQIFTAGLDGYLSSVRVYAENDPTSPNAGPIIVSIQTVTADGLASGREVASGKIVVCSDPPVPHCVPPAGSPGWVDVGISPLIVSAGTRYAITLRASGSGHIRWYDFIGPSAYPGGYMVGNDGSGWWSGTYDDMMFETYVTMAALDQSQTATNSYATIANNATLDHSWAETIQVAQTFTPGVSGYLHRVRVMLENHSATAPISVSIRETQGRLDGAYPTGQEIGRGTIPVEKLPPEGFPGWVDVTIDDPTVVAGTPYGIVLSMTGTGWLRWYDNHGDVYPNAAEFEWVPTSWFNSDIDYSWGPRDATFETYVLRPMAQSSAPPAKTITPCLHWLCPATIGGFTPWDKTDGVMSYFLFSELPNGTVHGSLNFTDSAPGGISLRGCSTDWWGCRLTVTTFACTDPHTLKVAGTYKRWGDTVATSYLLTLSGVWDGPGAFTLTSDGYTYTLTHDRIVHVTCPPATARPPH